MVEIDTIKRRFQLLTEVLDERTRRLVAAAEALSIGRGGKWNYTILPHSVSQ
jgi:hypothetical protein